MDLRIRLVDGVISTLLLNVQRSAFRVQRSAFRGAVRTSVTLMGQDIGNTVTF
jgi:CRISPR/Cas system-associated endoribonuclease Cas2